MAGSGRIYQRAGIYFIAYSHGGREFRESSRSRNLARRLLASRIVDRPIAPAPDAPRVTFDDLTRLYLEEYEVRQFRGPKTAKQRVLPPDRCQELHSRGRAGTRGDDAAGPFDPEHFRPLQHRQRTRFGRRRPSPVAIPQHSPRLVRPVAIDPSCPSIASVILPSLPSQNRQ